MLTSSGGFVPNPGQRRATELLRGPQRHTLLAGGARSGKTFLLTRALVVRAMRAPGSRHAVLRFRANAARSSIALDTLPKVMRTCFPEVPLKEYRQDGFFELPNGAQIWIGGLDDKERVEKILGQEYATLYFNECSQIPYSSVLVARTRLAQQVEGLRQRAYYDLNPGGTGHWTNHEFGEHRDPLTRRPLPDPEEYRRAFISPDDNAANLSPEFLKSLANLPEKQRRRFYEGRYVDEVDGALWTYETIEACRVDSPVTGPLTPADCDAIAEKFAIGLIVVAVDPSGASGKEDKRSDEIGIVVVGKSADGNAYVLEDCSLRAGPEEWGRVVARAHERWAADRVVAERNFGGAMVEAVLKAADRSLRVRLVTASRGKHVRAEPVAVLYDAADRRVRHLGRFPDLEDQMVNFSASGYAGERSPDRADALVWALTDIGLRTVRQSKADAQPDTLPRPTDWSRSSRPTASWKTV
jgi:phage terminase large subunit-like protein